MLVVGGGCREHALCWALGRDSPDGALVGATGNPGTATLGTNLLIAPTDVDALVAAAAQHDIDVTIIGPEAPLAAGLADRLRAADRAVFGPSQAAARLESSKAHAKEVMRRAGVPTGASVTFTELAPALEYIQTHAEPLVVKASGLAAGKGVLVCVTRAEAADAARAMLTGSALGEAGREVVIEEFLEGEELSVLALTDGEHIVILPPARAAVTTVLAARGYPEKPERGAAIHIPKDLGADIVVFHAGTARDADGTIRTSGGRVLSVTGLGAGVPAAARASAAACERIAFEGKTWRRDIAWRELQRARAA